MPGIPTRSKYPVAPKEARTLDGFTYASKAECRRAKQLKEIVACGEATGWLRQVKVQLGPDFAARIDFLVFYPDGALLEEVKNCGREPREFRFVRRLWPKYGPAPLLILKPKGAGWTREVIQGRPLDPETVP